MFFDEKARAGDWREQVLHCRDQGVSINREVAFAVAVADLLQLPDELPLMPAVMAAMSVPTRLSDRASLAHLRAVAHAAGRAAWPMPISALHLGQRARRSGLAPAGLSPSTLAPRAPARPFRPSIGSEFLFSRRSG